MYNLIMRSIADGHLGCFQHGVINMLYTSFSACIYIHVYGASLVAQTVKNLPAMQETQVQSLSWEETLEKGMSTHSSTFAWRIPWSLAGYSPWSHKELDTSE